MVWIQKSAWFCHTLSWNMPGITLQFHWVQFTLVVGMVLLLKKIGWPISFLFSAIFPVQCYCYRCFSSLILIFQSPLPKFLPTRNIPPILYVIPGNLVQVWCIPDKFFELFVFSKLYSVHFPFYFFNYVYLLRLGAGLNFF